jgi:hypothetical protein
VGRRRGWWSQREGGPTERKKKERGRRIAGLGREERDREGLGSFLFLNLFKLTFQTFEIELFSKHSKIFRTFLKAFKTSHKQIIKPCIQIMMHKHLLLLDY